MVTTDVLFSFKSKLEDEDGSGTSVVKRGHGISLPLFEPTSDENLIPLLRCCQIYQTVIIPSL